MPSNSFGDFFRITTWGESHGEAIGVIIDGCPPNIEISEDEINLELEKRSPGKNPFTSSRKEEDRARILSGTLNNVTTAAPISILIENTDKDSSSYDEIKELYRPSHANFTYLQKYGLFDHRGGGRASARETAARVAAGALAKKILKKNGIELVAFVNSIGSIDINLDTTLSFEEIKKLKHQSSLFCPDPSAEKEMLLLLSQIKKEKDSIGSSVKLVSTNLPIGLGDPIYEKLSSNLAKAFLTIPACVGMEIGQGFKSCKLKGSENNDKFDVKEGKVFLKTNNSGGILAGISTGNPLDITIGFKPTPTIEKPQDTISVHGKKQVLEIKNFRHDICLAIRGCAVVEAMGAIVLLNALLQRNLLKV